MGYSYKVVYNRDNRKNKSGLHSISIRVTVDRASRYLPLKERIEEKYWNGKDNRWIKENHPAAFELNSLIRKKIDLLHKYEYRQKLFGNGITLQGIEEYFYKTADPNVFNEYVAEFMKSVKGKSLNTLKKYRTFVDYLNEFNPKINFQQLNEHFFRSFATRLSEKGMMGVTVLKYFDPFKVIVKQAVKDGYLEKDPFLYANLGVKATKGERIYLEMEEISQLKNAKIPDDRGDLRSTRDHWLFCFYSATYYSNLLCLKWSEVILTEQGYWVSSKRVKNDNPL